RRRWPSPSGDARRASPSPGSAERSPPRARWPGRAARTSVFERGANAGTVPLRGGSIMSDDLKTKVQELIDTMINPAVAGHGGFVELSDVQDNRVYLQMGGGCQGCGAADITLKAGIERLIKEELPEVAEVLDTTDHAAGANPYYTAGKA